MAKHKCWWHARPHASIKMRALLDLHDGRKKTLVRPDVHPLYAGFPADWRVGQIIVLLSRDLRWPFRIVNLRRYETLAKLIEQEELDNIAHGNKIQAIEYLATVLAAHAEQPMLAVDLELISKEEAAWPNEKRG